MILTFPMILVCLLGLFVCSCANVSSSTPRLKPSGHYNDLPTDALRHISEYCYGHGSSSSFNPLRLVNRFTLASFSSLQDVIAQKFGYPLLRNLPGTPELFHLINLKSNDLTEILQSSKYLDNSKPIIMEALLQNHIEGSINLSNDELKKIFELAKNTGNALLIAKLFVVNYHCLLVSFDNYLKGLLLEGIEILSQNEAELIKVFNSQIPKENRIYIAIALFLSNLPIEEIQARIELFNLQNNFMFNCFVCAITQAKATPENNQKFHELALRFDSKIDNPFHRRIIQLLMTLKFDNQMFNLNSFKVVLKNKDFLKKEYETNDSYFVINYQEFAPFTCPVWKEYFIIVSIQVGRFDVGRATVISDDPWPLRIIKMLTSNPQLLEGIPRSLLREFLGEYLIEEFINYRINADPINFDSDLDYTTFEDLIVSANIHSPKRFISVVNNMATNKCFRCWKNIIMKLFTDVSLSEKLKALANSSQFHSNNNRYFRRDYLKMSFPVFREVLLRFKEFRAVFGPRISLNNVRALAGVEQRVGYLISISTEVMAQVLRDDALFKILQRKKRIIFPKIVFSLREARKCFTDYDNEKFSEFLGERFGILFV